jgi:hypothetical protein
MKKTIIILIALVKITFCNAQYSKDKLTDILTGGTVKTWSVKGSESTYSFNKNMSAEIKTKSAAKTEKWALSSPDNIRWFISIGAQKYELIVSYDKSGKQYVKLNSQSGDSKASGYTETVLYPLLK